MKQEAFEKQNQAAWEQMEAWIEALNTRRVDKLDDGESIGRDFPGLYRKVCHHLALARARRYSAGLQQRLNQLALDGHQHMYRARLPFFSATARFFANDFPAAFRRHWRYVLASHLVFYLPALGMALAVILQPALIYSLLDPGTVFSMETMYDPDNDRLGRERQSDTDLMMFGYYVYNNISIGFQTFAGGLLFGLGSLFFLIFNGLYFGAVATHLTVAGYTSTFWTFVIAHGAPELTAIVIFGAAGLMLSLKAIAPGRKRRWHAVRDAASDALPLVYGGTAMLLLAAFIEAFWSSTSWPPTWVKYTVGTVFWVLTYGYLLLLGRNEPR